MPLNEKSKTRELWLVNDVRIVGAVGVVELSVPVDQAWFQKAFIVKGVYIRPFRNLCYIIPPHIISREQLRTLISALAGMAGYKIHGLGHYYVHTAPGE